MTVNTILVYGMVIGYSLEDNYQTLCVDTLIWINKNEKVLNFEIPAYGEDYNFFCNQLHLYTKDGKVNLNFLPETYVKANLFIEDGFYKIVSMEMDIPMR